MGLKMLGVQEFWGWEGWGGRNQMGLGGFGNQGAGEGWGGSQRFGDGLGELGGLGELEHFRSGCSGGSLEGLWPGLGVQDSLVGSWEVWGDCSWVGRLQGTVGMGEIWGHLGSPEGLGGPRGSHSPQGCCAHPLESSSVSPSARPPALTPAAPTLALAVLWRDGGDRGQGVTAEAREPPTPTCPSLNWAQDQGPNPLPPPPFGFRDLPHDHPHRIRAQTPAP